MKKLTGLQIIVIGIMLWLVLALLVAGLIWWIFGVWPDTDKAWIFILFLSPVIWLVMEAASDIMIDLVEYALPRVRYMNRILSEYLAKHRQEVVSLTEGVHGVAYVLRAGMVILLVYIVWQWLGHKLYLPDRSHAVEEARMWWYNNFK